MKKLLTLLILLVMAGGAFAAYRSATQPSDGVAYRTATVERGDIVVSVSATGTLEPEDLIDVGAQVIGRIKELGTDPKGKVIDYGSQVAEDQVLAVIDDSTYRAQRDQAKAALQRSEAELKQLRAALHQAEREFQRAELLQKRQANTEASYDMAQLGLEAARANLEVGQATIAQNTASLELAETNLAYTVIRSPVSGTVIDRRVNVGQTVVSSLSAPSLFLIAKDLRRMQVWASVNEADIGLLTPGMEVEFSVDAFPNDVFKGQVREIRLNATMTQNVVTYTVVVENDNSNLKLLPYLTANAKFLIKKVPGTLMVPNGAFRYVPAAGRVRPGSVETAAHSSSAGAESEQRGAGRLWVRNGQFVNPVRVAIGETDGTHTAVSSDQLKEGDEVVLGEDEGRTSEQVTNPFAPPKIPKSAKGSGKPQ